MMNEFTPEHSFMHIFLAVGYFSAQYNIYLEIETIVNRIIIFLGISALIHQSHL